MVSLSLSLSLSLTSMGMKERMYEEVNGRHHAIVDKIMMILKTKVLTIKTTKINY